MTCFC